MSMYGPLKILIGNANPEFAKRICQTIGFEPIKAKIDRFNDGEIEVEIDDSVRGCDVFVIQATCPPVNENLMELLVVLDALKRASAGRITAVIPYFGYARQDRKVAPRAPITAKLVADLITVAGANRVLTCDLHAGQIQGFFNIPVDHLYAAPVFLKYIYENYLKLDEKIIIISPDPGGVERAKAYASKLKSDLGIVDKRRSEPGKSKVYNIIGDVNRKHAIILDDMIDGGNTACEAAKELFKKGASRISTMATHAVLSPGSSEKLNGIDFHENVFTDTIRVDPEKGVKIKRLKIVTITELFAKAILCIHENESLNKLFV